MKFAALTLHDFSVVHIADSILPTVWLLSKLEPILSNPATAFIIYVCVCVCVCGGWEVLTGTFIHAREQQHCYKHTQRPVFPQHSQTYIPLK